MRTGIGAGSRAAAATLLGVILLGCATGTPGDEGLTPASPGSSPSWPARAQPPGDGAPNEADNNGWEQRHELTPDEQRTGDALAARIRPALTALRTAGDFAPESTRDVLLALGLDPGNLQVTAMRTPPGASTPPAGAVFAVTFPEAGCIIGDVRPDRLLIEVTGAGAEFGCLEPFTH